MTINKYKMGGLNCSLLDLGAPCSDFQEIHQMLIGVLSCCGLVSFTNTFLSKGDAHSLSSCKSFPLTIFKAHTLQMPPLQQWICCTIVAVGTVEMSSLTVILSE